MFTLRKVPQSYNENLLNQSLKLECNHSKSKSVDLNKHKTHNQLNLSQNSLFGVVPALQNNNSRNLRIKSSSSNAYFTEEDILKSNGTNLLNHPNKKDLYNNIKPDALNTYDYNVSLNSINGLGYFPNKNSSISVLDTYNCQTPVFSNANCIEFTNQSSSKYRNIHSYSERLNFRREFLNGQTTKSQTNRDRSKSIKNQGPHELYGKMSNDTLPQLKKTLSISKSIKKSKFDTISDIIGGNRIEA